MKRNYSNSEVGALIMDWLERHGRWGTHYFPLDTIVNKLSHVVKNNGKRIRRVAKELLEEGYMLSHKRGDAISLNPTRSREIADYIRKIIGP
jgi:hypothetical protein